MMTVDLMATRLAECSVDEASIRDLLPLLTGVLSSGELRERAAVQADALRSRIGQYFATGSVFDDGESRPGSVEGTVPLVALLDALGDVDAHWRTRGFPSDVRAATAAEIKRQLLLSRRITGLPGMADAPWIEVVFKGAFATVGRMSYELIQDNGGYALSVHIPEGGSLDPTSVNDSLNRGRELMERCFPELAPLTQLVCVSWLLDPRWQELLPGSNIAKFGALWQIEWCKPDDADALYFVFDVPRGSVPAVSEILPNLKASSRLQQALIDRWSDGDSVSVCRGVLIPS